MRDYSKEDQRKNAPTGSRTRVSCLEGSDLTVRPLVRVKDYRLLLPKIKSLEIFCESKLTNYSQFNIQFSSKSHISAFHLSEFSKKFLLDSKRKIAPTGSRTRVSCLEGSDLTVRPLVQVIRIGVGFSHARRGHWMKNILNNMIHRIA